MQFYATKKLLISCLSISIMPTIQPLYNMLYKAIDLKYLMILLHSLYLKVFFIHIDIFFIFRIVFRNISKLINVHFLHILDYENDFKVGLDDPLDAVAVHGAGGLLGVICVPFFMSANLEVDR